MSGKLRPLPDLESDAAAERFVAEADLSEYDLSGFRPVQFEFAPKEARVNMRLPAGLLALVKEVAAREGMPYQRFIRRALERAVAGRR
ncbi:MAG: CopG family antitoxin [Thalassobaculales bacterium]